jgi:pimeloyl-ACP methyl ester carboxylesterase
MSYGAIEARDLSQVLDALEARGLVAGPIGVFGISYGAAVGIQFAARDRRVRAVVAVASFSSLRSVIPRYVRLFFPVRGWFMSEGQIQAAIDRAAERAGFDPDGADVGEAMAFGGFGKPFAMVETNDAAERLPLPGLKVVIEGSPSRQLAYHQKLLVLAQEQKFRFVISFIHQDYDALWEKIKGSSPELFMAWRDCGLLDERGRPRPALETWKGYFTLELEE